MEEDILKKRIERERAARKNAEAILETKSLELYNVNKQLVSLNENLEGEIKIRSEELANSEQRYRGLVEQASDIFFNIDTSGKFLYMNATGVHRFGYSSEEIIGHYFSEFVPSPHKKQLIVHYAEFIMSNRKSDYKEFPISNKSGDVFWIGQNVNRLFDEEGNCYFSAVARDISKRIEVESKLTKAQGALIKSEVKYRSVIENMRLGLLEVDTNGIIIKSYDRFNQMLGYVEGELEGKSANKVLLAEGFDSVIDAQDENRRHGESGVYELKLQKKNGEDIWMLISGTPFYNEVGEVIGSLGIHYDITAEKILTAELELARQAAVKAQKAEKQFLANMSHEIRTPLNAIIGMSHLIGDTPLDEEQTEYIDILKNSAGNLKNLISDILDMSKIDAGTLVLQEKEFNLEKDVKSLVQSFLPKTKDKAVFYKYIIDPKIENQILTDRQLLNQVLLNLFSNADKFTEAGEVVISISVKKQTKKTYTLLFSVTDTGIGIEENEAKAIFEEFKQASQEIRSKYGGTGLGLAISKKLLNLMGSEIKLESVLGQGSNFYFQLKVNKGRSVSDKDLLNEKIDFTIFGNDSNLILVVEDNKLNVKYLTRLLEKWGIDYIVKSNGQEAVDFCRKNFVDLILMDLQMPILDGFEATKIIRKMGENPNATIPIIALTASTFLSKKQMAEQVGMTDFLSKPFTPDQLSAILKKYLLEKLEIQDQVGDSGYDSRLDTTYLMNAYGEDTAYAMDIFETFMEIIDGELEILKSVINNNHEALKNHLHKIKPIFTMVGLSDISRMIEDMENSLSIKDEVLLKSQYTAFSLTTKKSLHIIAEELNRLKAIG